VENFLKFSFAEEQEESVQAEAREAVQPGLKFELEVEPPEDKAGAIIKIIGIGGCGCNIVHDMHAMGVHGASLVAVNTDMQQLNQIEVPEKVQIGKASLKGRGSGGDHVKGEHAAEEDRVFLENMLRGTDMLFLVSGIGKGTGTGATPVLAEIAKELEILTVSVMITPFELELSDTKKRTVDTTVLSVKGKVNQTIVISNQSIYETLDPNIQLKDAYHEVNKSIVNVLNGLVNMITKPGMQNIDFEDVRSALRVPGNAFMGLGRAGGTDRVRKALEKAINDPFTGRLELTGAKCMLVNIAGSLNMAELNDVKNLKKMTGDVASLSFGTFENPELGDDIAVMVVMSGIEASAAQQAAAETLDQAPEGWVQAAAKPGDDEKLAFWVRKNVDSDYNDIDRPTYQRIRQQGN